MSGQDCYDQINYSGKNSLMWVVLFRKLWLQIKKKKKNGNNSLICGIIYEGYEVFVFIDSIREISKVIYIFIFYLIEGIYKFFCLESREQVQLEIW